MKVIASVFEWLYNSNGCFNLGILCESRGIVYLDSLVKGKIVLQQLMKRGKRKNERKNKEIRMQFSIGNNDYRITSCNGDDRESGRKSFGDF
jgi:hypothetical protein